MDASTARRVKEYWDEIKDWSDPEKIKYADNKMKSAKRHLLRREYEDAILHLEIASFIYGELENPEKVDEIKEILGGIEKSYYQLNVYPENQRAQE